MEFMEIFNSPAVQQVAILCVLAVGLILFIKGRFRYDIISLFLMLSVIAIGALSAEEAFSNFGHSAIIIVASMFVMSEALVSSGVVDAVTARMRIFHTYPILGLGILVIAVIIMSAFMNNAGALAIVVPIAVHLARKSKKPIALFLLPLAFASHLGGFMTLIGTPRNILISDFRLSATGAPFQMFDFFPVGGVVALAGAVFLIGLSWRFIPVRKEETEDTEIKHTFVTEVMVPADSKIINTTIGSIEGASKGAFDITGVYRDGEFIKPTTTLELIAEDKLLVAGDIESLTYYTEHYHLRLTGMRAIENYISNDDEQVSVEAFVPPYSKLVGQTWQTVPLKERYGINFLGIARHDAGITSELESIRIWPNDILLLRGRTDSLKETINSFRLFTTNNTVVPLGRTLKIVSVLAILLTSIAIASLNILPLPTVFLATALILIVFNFLSLRQAYESIDQTVLILLAGMITLGEALQRSGAAESIANFALGYGALIGPAIMLGVVLILTIIMSDFMNTTASAVTMAPIAILIAQNLGVSVDTYLMAVAIGASCAFLTPIGHESNAMVMKRGGYTFKDYFRVGLPLELLIITISIPLILYFWPLYV